MGYHQRCNAFYFVKFILYIDIFLGELHRYTRVWRCSSCYKDRQRTDRGEQVCKKDNSQSYDMRKTCLSSQLESAPDILPRSC